MLINVTHVFEQRTQQTSPKLQVINMDPKTLIAPLGGLLFYIYFIQCLQV